MFVCLSVPSIQSFLSEDMLHQQALYTLPVTQSFVPD